MQRTKAETVSKFLPSFFKKHFSWKQLAARLLQELEHLAVEDGFTKVVLETGLRQVEAQRLYSKAGYFRTENYGQNISMEDSIYYRKKLK